jgi:hypothetical protein
MRTIRSSITPVAFTLAVSLVLAACAGSASSGLSNVGNSVGGETGGSGTGGLDAGAPGASGAPSQGGDGVGAILDDARIIRTGTIDLEVTDLPAALQAARTGIRSMGGYIGASQTRNIDDQPTASITYRIPSARWEEALDLLRGLSGLTTKVVEEQTQAVEVTGAIIDLEARIRNLRASETALQEIASGATRISDVLEVQAQLTTVRGQIEQLSAQLGDLNDRAGFATLTASFRVPIVAVQVAAKGWEPGVVVDQATASLLDVVQALTTAGIWFAIVWLPILLVLGLIALGVAAVVRRLGWAGRPRTSSDLPTVG